MKITGYSDSLRITSGTGRDIGSLLKGISVGDRVEARIITREGNLALLDIAGKRIRAEFTAGIPSGNIVELELSGKSKNSAVFRLHVPGGASDLPVFLKQFFMAGDKIPDRETAAGLLRLLSGNRADITDINLFLAGIKKDNLKEKKFSDLINRLKILKVPGQTLTDISLAAAMKLPAAVFSSILFIIEKSGKKHGFTAGDERIDEILHDIENLDDELFTNLLKLLAEPVPENEGCGSFPFFEEGEIPGIEYVYKNDSFFMTFSLSEVGRICLFIRSDSGHAAMSIGADNDRAVETLKMDSEALEDLLRQNGAEIRMISFFNTKKVIDKLQMLCRDFQLKSGLDVRI